MGRLSPTSLDRRHLGALYTARMTCCNGRRSTPMRRLPDHSISSIQAVRSRRNAFINLWRARSRSVGKREEILRFRSARDSTKKGGGKNRILFSNPNNLSRADGKEELGLKRDRKNVSSS